MRSDSGRTQSTWTAHADVPDRPPLATSVTCDVCVVGAGISGMTTAYLLGRAGKRVVVIDDGPVAGGETSRSTAHLASAQDDFYSEIERVHGEEGARIAAASHSAAVAKVGEIAAAEGIECGYARVDGYLFLAKGDDPKDLEEELAAARRAGVEVEFVERAPISSFDTGRCLRFANQGQFDPVRYVAGLVRAIERDGGRIYNGTAAREIADGTPATVTTAAGHTISAQAVVVATNSPVNDLLVMHTKQAPYRTYVVAVRVPAGSVTPALYWDSADPYHYVRLEKAPGEEPGREDLLIVGGEDHKTGQADDMDERWRCLEEWTRERFPQAAAVEHRWSGQVMEPVDFMGFIGRNPGDKHVYIVTGDSGQGTTHGTIAGMLLTDLITGRPNPWETLYDPSRKSIRPQPALEFAKENLNVAARYLELVTPGEIKSPDEVKPGEGAVLRRGATKVAVYRDRDGQVHERSAICTHLHCVVHWNHGEGSWDCPCHGSRFDPYGRVLNGPAISDLPEVKE
jgi:glycine/D-amino acid oxidase-like deaminating enzyme/nitrite reductase/ring-hydroxylating ferredoxin subunit